MVVLILLWVVKILGTDINYAWPTAEIAVLGPEAAITIMHRKNLKNSC